MTATTRSRRRCSWTMTRNGLRRLVSVAAGPLVLFGCATQIVEFPPQTPRGHIAARPGRPGLVVAAPHGSSDAQTGEIATGGVDTEYAQRLRALCEMIRDAHLRGHARAPRLEVLVEPADPIFYAASGAKRDGILRLPERALHIELPKTARVEFRELYTAILVDFVAQAVTLPRGR